MRVSEREIPVAREFEGEVRGNPSKLYGLAIPYGVRSLLIHEHGQRFFEVIEPGAFDLAARNITFTFRHDDAAEYGDTASGTLRLQNGPNGVSFELDLPRYAHTLRTAIETKVITGMSFGFVPRDVRVDADGVRHVHKGDLLHISPVYSPAYGDHTSVDLRAIAPRNLYRLKLDIADRA